MTFFGPRHLACEISGPWPGIEHRPRQWKHQILTTRPPRNSQQVTLKKSSERYTDQWNGESRNKPLYLRLDDFWQGCQDQSIAKWQSSQNLVLGKLDIPHDKKKWTLTSHHTKRWKWIKDLHVTVKIIKIFKGSRGTSLWHCIWQWFLGYDIQSTGN